MIEVINLSAGYNQTNIIKGINLYLNSKEIVGLFGSNGSGKTTILRSIVGQLDAYGGKIFSGYVRLNDLPINTFHTHELVRKGISFVPDSGRIFSSMTVRENLQMGGYLINNKSCLDKQIETILSIFKILSKLQNRIAGTLSGGERQILSLGRSLIIKPKYLLLDEPTAGLSYNYITVLCQYLKEIKHQAGILIVEQNIKGIYDLIDRGYKVDNGRITASGNRSDLKQAIDING